MRKYLPFTLALLILILGVSTTVLASNTAAAIWSGIVRVTNNSTAATGVSVNFSANTSVYIAGGYMYSSGNNTAIQFGGSDVSYMPGYAGNPWIVYQSSIGASTIADGTLYMGGTTDMAAKIRYFPGPTGANVTDSVSLEPSDNATIRFDDIYAVTSGNEEDEIYALKPQAFKIYGDSGNVTAAAGLNVNLLDFEKTNSDNVTIPDSNAFTFNTGGQDTPFSFTGSIRLEANAGYLAFFSKQGAPTSNAEYLFYIDVANNLIVQLSDPTTVNYLAKTTTALADAVWYRVAVTYDGSETIGGINIYLNAVLQTNTANATSGYTGMTNTTSAIGIGQSGGGVTYFDGSVSNFKLYNVELTAAEVLYDFYGVDKRADLIAWWKLIDGAGNPVDSSGNGHNATTNTADWLITGGKYLGASEATMTLADGETDLSFISDSANMWLTTGTSSSANATVTAVPDTAYDWGLAGGVTYLGSINMSVGGPVVGSWEWEYAATFTDDSGNGNTMTPTFRTTSSDADVSAELVGFGPIEEADAPPYTVTDPPPLITANISVSGNFSSNVTSSSAPGIDVITAVAAASGTPAPFILYLISGVALLGLSMSISYLMRDGGSTSLVIKILIILGALGVLIAINVFDDWVLYLFAMLAIGIAFIASNRQFEGTGNFNNNLLGFLIMAWLGLMVVNNILEGVILTTAERSMMNNFLVFQPWNIAGLFTLPVPSISFLTVGLPALMEWDYTAFGGNAQIFTYLMYSVTGVVAFLFFTVAMASAANMFFRSR